MKQSYIDRLKKLLPGVVVPARKPLIDFKFPLDFDFKFVERIVAADSTRPGLCGVLWDDVGRRLVSSDGRRLHVLHMGGEFSNYKKAGDILAQVLPGGLYLTMHSESGKNVPVNFLYEIIGAQGFPKAWEKIIPDPKDMKLIGITTRTAERGLDHLVELVYPHAFFAFEFLQDLRTDFADWVGISVYWTDSKHKFLFLRGNQMAVIMPKEPIS